MIATRAARHAGLPSRFPDGLTIIDWSQLRIDFKKLRPAPENTPEQSGGE